MPMTYDPALRGLVMQQPGSAFEQPQQRLSPGSRANEPLELAALRDQRRRELLEDVGRGVDTYVGGGPHTGGGYVGEGLGAGYTQGKTGPSGYQRGANDEALNQLKMLDQETAADPFIGAGAQKQEAENLGRYQSAVAQGFRGTDPVREAAEYEQAQAQEKMNIPVKQAQTAGEYDLAKQRVASQGALDVAKTQQEGIANRYAAMQDLLQGGGIDRLRGVNPSTGNVTLGAPAQTPTAIDRDVTTARQNYDKAKSNSGGIMSSLFGDQALNLAKAQLDTAISMALARHPADPSFKDFAKAVAEDPQYANMTLPQILQAAGETDITPEEMQQLDSLLRITRGY